MNIAFNVSQEHTKYMMVVIESIFKYNLPQNIHFYVLTEGISTQITKKIKEYLISRGSNIDFIKMDPVKFEGFNQYHGSYSTFFKMFLHELLPNSADRVLYLDDDIIVRCNLSELYCTDFENKVLVSPYDIKPFRRKFLQNLPLEKAGLEYETNLFCAGIVLFNLTLLREMGINKDTYLNCIKGIDNYHFDQGILNKLFCGDADLTKFVLPHIYNYFPMCAEDYEKYMQKNGKTHFARIVHYASWNKPWKSYGSTESAPFHQEWWEIASNSLFYQDILESTLKYLDNNNKMLQIKMAEIYSDEKIKLPDYEKSIETLNKTCIVYSSAIYKKVDVLLKKNTSDSIKQALDICHNKKYKEDPEIRARLGDIYESGLGVEINMELAMEHYKFAATHEIDYCKWKYFDLLWRYNTPETDKLMVEYASIESEKGNIELSARLGKAYYSGRGVKRDLHKAADLLRNTLKTKPWWGKLTYWDVVWELKDAELDKEIFQFILKETQHGSKLFYGRLARMLRDGRGTDKDLSTALFYMELAAEDNSRWAPELEAIKQIVEKQ